MAQQGSNRQIVNTGSTTAGLPQPSHLGVVGEAGVRALALAQLGGEAGVRPLQEVGSGGGGRCQSVPTVARASTTGTNCQAPASSRTIRASTSQSLTPPLALPPSFCPAGQPASPVGKCTPRPATRGCPRPGAAAPRSGPHTPALGGICRAPHIRGLAQLDGRECGCSARCTRVYRSGSSQHTHELSISLSFSLSLSLLLTWLSSNSTCAQSMPSAS